MTTRMVFLPVLTETACSWAERLSERYPQVTISTPSVDDAPRELADADAAFGTLTPELLAAAKQLKWLQAPMAAPPAGFYFPELVSHPLKVTNFRGIYNDHISYHILGLMLSFTKHLHDYRDQQRNREWKPLTGADYNNIYLPACTVLMVGCGGIGLETARLLKTIGCRVVGTDARLTIKPEWLDELHPSEALDSLLPVADFVVLTVPHTPATGGFFNAERFARMKSSAIFINIGRGMTTRLDDLNTALRSGQIRGAALDVYEVEPLPSNHPLWDAPNTLLTPHSAVAGAAHLDERRYAIIEDNLGRFLRGDALYNVVDKEKWF